MYVPTDDNWANMHFIINGEDQGACVKHIPYKAAPLHVVVDVYGTTKQVRIIQLYGGKSRKRVPLLFTILQGTFLIKMILKYYW